MFKNICITASVLLIWAVSPLSAHPHPGPYMEPTTVEVNQGEEKIVGATTGVIFTTVDLLDGNGHNYGLEIYAHNQTRHTKEVKIEMGQYGNVSWNFPNGWFLVEPGQKVFIGTIKQSDMQQEWSWYINWWVR